MPFNVRKNGRLADLHFGPDTLLGADAEESPVVRVSLSVPIRDFVELSRALSGLASGDLEGVSEALGSFGDRVLVEWDLQDDDGDIPATGEGMQRVPIDMAMEIMNAWIGGVSAPDPTSPAVSPNGAQSEELFGVTAAE